MDNEKNYEELLSAFANASDTTKRIVEALNNQEIRNVLSEMNSDIITVNSYVLTNAEKSLTDQILFRYMNTKEMKVFSAKTLNYMADLLADTTVRAAIYKTTMIDSVVKSIAALNIQGLVSAVQEAVDKSDISMADYSFMKTYPLMKGIQNDLKLPYGFKTDINTFNRGSADKISSNKEIIYNTHKRAFISGSNMASVSEINTICSAIAVFDEIGDEEYFTEEEIMSFVSFLDATPKLGISNPTGEKIYRLIKNIKDLNEFDHDQYYHSRLREKDKAPYVWNQMLKAPYGVSSAGRFNEIGQARFYFADAEIGAVNEIRKHVDKSRADDYVIQTVLVSARNPINMLDLSAKTMRNLNTFLKHLRYPLSSDSGKRPREYLLPQFVGECCESCGIDGIKYYGGKNYSNYVTWSDSFFGFVRNVGDSESK